MILQFDLLPKFQRPVIALDFGDFTQTALVDTGALVPVFTDDTEILLALGGKLECENVKIGGVGGKANGDLYRIDLKLGKVTFKSLPIVCTSLPSMPFPFILSATMFSDFNYMIDNEKHKLVVDTRTDDSVKNLRYKSKNGNWIVLAGAE